MCVFIGDVAMAMEAPVYNLGPIFPPMSSVKCSVIQLFMNLLMFFYNKILEYSGKNVTIGVFLV